MITTSTDYGGIGMDRILSTVADAFRNAFSRLNTAISLRRHRGQGLGSASPGALVKNVLRAADGASIAWDESELLYPNSILIFVGHEPWDAYYSKMLDDSQARINAKLQEHIHMQGGTSMQLNVRIGLDPLLQGTQTRVETAFNESIADPSRTPVLFLNNEEEHDRMKTQVMFGQADEHVDTTPSAGREYESPNDQEEPLAYVAYGRLRYEVRDGTTIGVLRYSDRKRADITLPREQCPGVSHIHGVFRYDSMSSIWSFENVGQNGTTAIHDGQEELLVNRRPRPIRNGYTLRLASGETEIRFVTKRS